MTLGSVGPRRDRAQLRRDHARVAGVERGLQAAREEEGQAQGEARKKRKDKKVIITLLPAAIAVRSSNSPSCC